MSNLVGAPVAVSLSPPTGLRVMILRSLAKNWSNYQLMRRCTCPQFQEHGKNGQCLGQRQDRAQDQSMLRKSPLALGNTYQCQSTKSLSTSLTSSSNGLHLELPLPATFAPSLSIHTPSPSHHLCLSSRQSPQQSLDCKFLKIEQKHFRERLHDIYLWSLDKEGFQEMQEQGSFTCISSLGVSAC